MHTKPTKHERRSASAQAQTQPDNFL